MCEKCAGVCGSAKRSKNALNKADAKHKDIHIYTYVMYPFCFFCNAPFFFPIVPFFFSAGEASLKSVEQKKTTKYNFNQQTNPPFIPFFQVTRISFFLFFFLRFRDAFPRRKKTGAIGKKKGCIITTKKKRVHYVMLSNRRTRFSVRENRIH